MGAHHPYWVLGTLQALSPLPLGAGHPTESSASPLDAQHLDGCQASLLGAGHPPKHSASPLGARHPTRRSAPPCHQDGGVDSALRPTRPGAGAVRWLYQVEGPGQRAGRLPLGGERDPSVPRGGSVAPPHLSACRSWPPGARSPRRMWLTRGMRGQLSSTRQGHLRTPR